MSLDWAADIRNSEIVQHLEHCTEINAQDPEGQTALHYACFVGHQEVIKVLLLIDKRILIY